MRQLMLFHSMGGNPDKYEETAKEFANLIAGKTFARTQDLDIFVGVAYSHPSVRKIALIKNVEDYVKVRIKLREQPTIYAYLLREFSRKNEIYEIMKNIDPIFTYLLLPILDSLLEANVPEEMIITFVDNLWDVEEYSRYTLGFFEFLSNFNKYESLISPDLAGLLVLAEGKIWRGLS